MVVDAAGEHHFVHAGALDEGGDPRGHIVAVADRSPAKQGRLLPGSHIPVVTPEALLALPLDDVLVLPWNIGGEIAHQLRTEGFCGRFFTAVPEMREIEV